MAMTNVGSFSLHNGGGFVVRISFKYIDDNGQTQRSETGDAILLGQTQTVNPTNLGVPDGVTLWLYADVQAGYDNQAVQGFAFQNGNSSVAQYTITGTTLNNTLGLIGVVS